jgi:hypothetical protein
MAHPERFAELQALPLRQMGLEDPAMGNATSYTRVREIMMAVSPWMVPIGTAFIAHTKMQMGRLDEARRELESLAELYFEGEGEDLGVHGWLFIIGLAAEVAVAVQDLERAEQIYGLLEPHAAKNVVHEGMPVYLGSAAHFLGSLAAALSRREPAMEHLEAALEQNERMAAWPHVARTQLALARLLAGRRPARARDLEQKARRAAREMGMQALLRT